MNYLGFDREKVQDTVAHLNELLANYQVYYQNLRSFHWYVQGENFFELHEVFENLYEDARVKIDEIAERILTLRLRPLGHMSNYLEKSEVEEATGTKKDREMIMAVLENHRIIIKKMREVIEAADKISDEGTIDMIGGFLGNIEKQSWMLDAWTSKKLDVEAPVS